MTECPSCGTALGRLSGAAPWCPECEWGLELFEPERHYGGVGWQWVDRRLYRMAYRRAARQYAALAGRELTRPGWTGARVLATAVALLVHASALAGLALGLWLIAHDFPSLSLLFGVVLVGVSIELWPRPARLPRDVTVLTAADAPGLHELVERVAAAIGSPRPAKVCLDDRFTAEAGVTGPLRRRYLLLGVPLWNCLSSQQRVALLGIQLAHLAERRLALTGTADASLKRLVAVLTPGRDRTMRAFQDTKIIEAMVGSRGVGAPTQVGLAWVSELLWRPVAAVLRVPIQVLRLALTVVPQRDRQHAEYHCDALAVRAAGSAATVQLLDVEMLAQTVVMALRRDARAGAPVSAWSRIAGRVLVECWPQIPLRRQLSIRREVSIAAALPPLGMRARMVESRPAVEPAVTLEADDRARIDAELARHYERVGRDLAR